MVRVEIVGADRLARTLTAASRAVGRLQAPNREAATRLAEAASQRAPRKSGRLAGSIRPFDVTEKGADIGSAVIYSAVQEFGWARHHIRAHRYLAGAARETDVTPVYNRLMSDAAMSIRGA